MWNETTILDRAKEMARTYCDEDRFTLTDVRAAVQEFCLNTRAVYGTEPLTTVANQRVYDLSRVFEIVRVRYQGNTIPQGYRDGIQSYQVRPSQIVLNFNPIAGAVLEVSGYMVPANVSDIKLQPVTAWQDAIAHLVAARVLRRYGDAQAVVRSREFESAGTSLVSALLRQLVQPYAPRPDAETWNTAYIVHRAREILHPYGVAATLTDADVLSAVREFCRDARCFHTETQHTTVANQTRYALRDVLYPQRVSYDGAEIPMAPDAPHTQTWYVEQNQLVLNWEPAAGKPLIIRGYGVPDQVNDLSVQPSDVYMDAIAGKLAAERLVRYSNDRNTATLAQYLLARYNEAVNQLRAQGSYTRLSRTGGARRGRTLGLT